MPQRHLSSLLFRQLRSLRRSFLYLGTLLILSGCLLVWLQPTASAANTFIVTNTSDSGIGSLRQAILDANVAAGSDTITFNIPGTGVHTVLLQTDLPIISDPVNIDGTTQPGYAGQPLIELSNGNRSNANRATLHVTGGSTTIRGLIINRSSNTAIALVGASGSVIQGNYLGTDSTGNVRTRLAIQ